MSDLVRSEAVDPDSEIDHVQTRVMQRHLRKTVLEYTVTFTDGSRKAYVGIHRENDPRLAITFSALQSLRARGFDDGGDLRVPQPLLFAPSLSFLLMTRADGRPLRGAFADPQADAVPIVRTAARWLARLHATDAEFPRTRTAEDDVHEVREYWSAITKVFPERSQQIETISRQLINRWLSGPRPALRPLHGDYHPKNIIASRLGVCVVDFDECCMGDPAFDLGYFVAQTKMSHGFGPRIVQATRAFVEEYVQLAAPDPGLLARARLHEAQTYLQRIYHTYVLLKLRPERELVAAWLQQSERCFEQGAA